MFADRLVDAVRRKGTPCIVGLDPRIEAIPDFLTAPVRHLPADEAAHLAIAGHNRWLIERLAPRVAAVKLQSAFYEANGLGGLRALMDTIDCARRHGLLVIVDVKRSDVPSTAAAYAQAYLGESEAFGRRRPLFDADAVTVTPFLGVDSLQPFVAECAARGKGLFVLVKTSNPGSADLQDLTLASGERLYERLGGLVDQLGAGLIGASGYSSIGAVVGATFPAEAARLRRIMPRAVLLVPGYGAQGGGAGDAVGCFNDDGLGALISASRSVTLPTADREIAPQELELLVTQRLQAMIDEVGRAMRERGLPPMGQAAAASATLASS
jgi:orotidine-5'-phosphate decarboxylase